MRVYDNITDQEQDNIELVYGIIIRCIGQDQVGQETILGMDFTVPVGIRLYLAHGTRCLPDEVCRSLMGLRLPYRSTIQAINVKDHHIIIYIGGSTDVGIGVYPLKAEIGYKETSRG